MKNIFSKILKLTSREAAAEPSESEEPNPGIPDEGSDKYWMLFKLWTGKLTSLALDQENNLYFVSDGRLFKLFEGKKHTVATKSDSVVDIASDSKGNLYVCSSDQVEILRMDAQMSELIIKDVNYKFKSICVDQKDNVYLLGDNGRGNRAFLLIDNYIMNMPYDDAINRPFAVDSSRNIYYNRYAINNLTKVPISGLFEESVNCVAVDNFDNAYFGTRSGMFVVVAEGYEAKRIATVNVGDICSIAFNTRGHIYFASIDDKVGGIYILRS